MSVRSQLSGLERRAANVCPAVPRLTDAERLECATWLANYAGNDPAILERREQIARLLDRARRRMLKAQGRRNAT